MIIRNEKFNVKNSIWVITPYCMGGGHLHSTQMFKPTWTRLTTKRGDHKTHCPLCSSQLSVNYGDTESWLGNHRYSLTCRFDTAWFTVHSPPISVSHAEIPLLKEHKWIVEWGIVWCIFSAVRKMGLGKGHPRSRRFSSLETFLIFLFVAMTCICISLTAIYFTDKANASADVEGECVYIEIAS